MVAFHHRNHSQEYFHASFIACSFPRLFICFGRSFSLIFSSDLCLWQLWWFFAGPAKEMSGPEGANEGRVVAQLPAEQPVIQLAILLDDSGSMNGLIDQARAHIWDVVHQLGATTKDGKTPILQVALYHYGDVQALHKPLLGFTSDLDIVSKKLFAINGGGGEERCGEVIRNAAQQLSWSDRKEDLRMIVIAGNEPFNQGSIDYKEAITAARGKNIVVSTIHCGDRAQGVAGLWSDGSHYGGGSFHNIDHNQRTFDIEAPQTIAFAR